MTEEPEEDREVDLALEGLEPTDDISESSEAFLAEMGIEGEDEDLDIVFGNSDGAGAAHEPDSLEPIVEQEEEEGDILEEFLSDIDDTEMVETLTNEIETNEAVEEFEGTGGLKWNDECNR